MTSLTNEALAKLQNKTERFDHVSKLSEKILEIVVSENDNKPLSIAIAGEGNAGKSTLSREIKSCFSGTVSILEIDRYILARSTRKRLGLSAYDPMAISVDNYSQAIRALLFGNQIWTPYYDHHSGVRCDYQDCSIHNHMVQPAELIIIEGAFLWHPMLNFDFCLNVYCENTQADSFASRIKRDVVQRGYTENDAKTHLVQLQKDATRFIKPSQDSCSIHVFLQQDYSYLVEFKKEDYYVRMQDIKPNTN